MPDITFTDFVNIAQSAGIMKLSKIKTVKTRGTYSPAKDYYKPLREKIIEKCERAEDIEDITIEIQLANAKKQENYKNICNNMISWKQKNKSLIWLPPPKGYFKPNIIGIKVNPELAFQAESGSVSIIKLHMNKEPLTKAKLQIAAYLFQRTLREHCPQNASFSFLDLHQGKIFPVKEMHDAIDTFLAAEVAYIEHIWDSV